MAAKFSLQKFIDAFIARHPEAAQWNQEKTDELHRIASHHLEDLTTVRLGYFSLEDQAKITVEAAHRLAQIEEPISLTEAWHKIAVDFHQNKYWGYPLQSERPKMTAPQRRKNKGIRFLWTAIQALVIMKVVILYFGTRMTNDPTPSNTIYFLIAFGFSFGSLFFFVWRYQDK